MNKEEAKKLEELKSLGIILDSKIEGPFGIRFGLDALVGLIPVLGDVVTSFVSLYIIASGAKLGCSPSTILRMVLNLFLENLVGTVPFLGNLFDFYWKANNMNVALIEAHLISPKRISRKSRWIIGLIVFSILILMVLTAYLGLLILGFIVAFLKGV